MDKAIRVKGLTKEQLAVLDKQYPNNENYRQNFFSYAAALGQEYVFLREGNNDNLTYAAEEYFQMRQRTGKAVEMVLEWKFSSPVLVSCEPPVPEYITQNGYVYRLEGKS